MQIEEVVAFLKEKSIRSVVLFCHHNADLDSFGSAFGFGELLKRINPGLQVSIVTPGGLSRLSKRLAEKLRVEITDSPPLSAADMVVLLDVNTVIQLDDWGDRIRSLEVPILLIDHHAPHPETQKLASFSVLDETAASTAEIVYRFWRETGFDIAYQEALALFLGIAYDTRHFALANSETFQTILDLIDHGIEVKEALQMIAVPLELPERLARLKAVGRAKIHRICSWVVAVSETSAFQASACRALLKVGADVAVVGGVKDEKLRISLRSTGDFFRKTGLHLGRDVAVPLGIAIDGAGGGHEMAAGANGRGDPVASLEMGLDLIRERLSLPQDR
ncbi:MAG: DHH family phosphoesterase [Candidatus Bathyarchaeota archaeon]|nr:MAG: DHH family phosphoesterase [Candidatus Bathyarchaeota archaeon]